MSEIGKLKLALFRDKLDSIVKLCQGEKKYDEMYPISVELSLTNDCNLKCAWCCDSTVRQKHPGHADKEILFDLFRDLQEGGTKGITIEGGGEPTMHPDFEEIIKKIRDHDMAVGLSTNGVQHEKVLSNIDSFEWIRVSLDADNPNTFKEHKGFDGFEKVMKNIERLAEKKGNVVLGVGYVATRYTMGNIEDVIERLRDVGVNYFYIRPVEDNPEYSSRNDMEWLKQYSTSDFEVIVNYYGRVKGGNANLPCVCHSISVVITADASVYMCGRLHIHPNHKPVGNLKYQSFNEIWNNKNRILQTKTLTEIDFTKKNCPVCRITKYNEFVDEIVRTKTINFI